MFRRIRRARSGPPPSPAPAPPVVDDEPSINGVMSLLGGDGVSLDGESVILPSEVDDMSALGASARGTDAGSIAFRVFDSTDEDDHPIPNEVGADSDNDSCEEEKREVTPGGCLPLWLTDAPQWMKIAIVLSTAILVGALVLIAVASVLDDQARGEGAVSSVIEGTETFPPIAPLTPTDAPSHTADWRSPSPSRDNDGAPNTETTTAPIAVAAAETTAPVVEETSEPSATTPGPTAAATMEPSVAPLPTTISPTTTSPTVAPTTAVPTLEPTPESTVIEGTTTLFYLTAGRPLDDELDDFEDFLPSIPTDTPGAFMVHLGDWNSPLSTECDEESYEDVADLYKRTSVPVYFVPGDNEYNDCPDPEQAYEFWKDHLVDFESKYWPLPPWEVNRDNFLEENFAFVVRRVLFVGLNLVGGNIHDEDEWEARHERNLDWLDKQFFGNEDDIDMLVVLCHADPVIASNAEFYDSLFDRIRGELYYKRTLLIHRNLGNENAGMEQDYDDIDDFDVLVAEGNMWPPMRVELTIDEDSSSVRWNQDDWFDEAEVAN